MKPSEGRSGTAGSQGAATPPSAAISRHATRSSGTTRFRGATGPLEARLLLPAAIVIAWLVVSILLPNHLPLGVTVEGLSLGALSAMTAMGLILIYRSARIINFSQGVIGGLAASAAVVLVIGRTALPYYAAVPIGLLVAAASGIVVATIVVRRFEKAPRLILTVATIGVAQILGAAEMELPRLFVPLKSVASFSVPFSFKASVGSFIFNGNYLTTWIVVPIALVAMWIFLKYTDTGIGIRAVADSPSRATLLGIPVRRLSITAWVVASLLSGVGATLSGPILGVNVGVASGPTDLLIPLVAAMLASMESLPVAVGWSLVIGIMQQAVYWSFHTTVYSDVALFVLLVVGMLLKYSARSGAGVADQGMGDYVAVQEVHPLPEALRRRPEVKVGRAIAIAAVAAVAIMVPSLLTASRVTLLSYIAIFGIIAVSLVVLSGWAGQISLGQFAFAGVGAATTASLMVHAHVEILVALAVAGITGAAVACVIGIPALRFQGLYLAVVTMAFAVPLSTWLLSPSYFPYITPSSINRPELFGKINLASPLAFYELCLAVLSVVLLAAWSLRNSRLGRAMLAVRDNGKNAAAYGISPMRVKLLAFGVSGAMASIAGGLYVVALGGISFGGFPPQYSIQIFAMVVIGGMGSLLGAILGAAYVEGVLYFLKGGMQLFATGAGLLVLLMILPGGLGGVAIRIRNRLAGMLSPRPESVYGVPGEPEMRGTQDGGVAATGAGQGSAQGTMVQAAHSTRALPETRANRSEESRTARAALQMAALESLELSTNGMTGTPVDGRQGDTGEKGDTPGYIPPSGGRPAILDAKGIDAHYGRMQALFNTGMGIAQGEIVAILGSNGSGKSTFLGVVSGLIPTTRGQVKLLGQDITRLNAFQRAHSGMIMVPARQRVFSSLTVAENLRLASWTVKRYHHDRHFAKVDAQRVLTVFRSLHERANVKAGRLSGGEQQMLALSQALLCRPILMLIDEMSLGLSPKVIDQLLQTVESLAASGVTFVIVEQSINVASAVAQRAVFFERGRIRFSGPTPSVEKQPELLRSVFVHAMEKADQRRATEGAGSSGAGGVAVPPTTVPPPGTAQNAQVSQPGASSTEALTVRNVSKSYGGLVAIENISLSVQQGEILGIIGANGAGKSTLIDILGGYTKPDTGRLALNGKDITRLSPTVRAELGLGRVFQDSRLFPSMAVSEALAAAIERTVPVRDPLANILRLKDARRSERVVHSRVNELMAQMGLTRYRDSIVSELSTGTRRMLELACALGHDPSVLLLDEPSSGIAQRESEALAELLLGVAEDTGATLIVIEHDVPLVSSIADRLVCLHLGRVIAEGSVRSVLHSSAVLAAYLGSDEEVLSASPTVGFRSGV
ncbi:MAG: ATP-binding cassette domain-containing protein [Actinobacteria bacterium]|nr:ATP-binding cassette domain-containing protein [Actinomycetota bacterium]